jgi:hypothetical protein
MEYQRCSDTHTIGGKDSNAVDLIYSRPEKCERYFLNYESEFL